MRTLLVLGALVLVAACDRTKDVYPPEVVDNFMQSCTRNAAKRDCRCTLEALERRFDVEQFRGFEERMRRGEVPKELVDATAECR